MSDAEATGADWRRLSSGGAPAEAPVPYEGIPDHLLSSLDGWFERVMDHLAGVYADGDMDQLISRVERTLRVGPYRDLAALWEVFIADAAFGLDVIDLLVLWISDDNDERWRLTELDVLLAEGGSVRSLGRWGTHAGLVRRVEESLRTHAQSVLEHETPAAEHLSAAWSSCFGPRPDPGRALDEAVKALEAAACSVISPRDRRATLGKMISALRTKPAKWTTELGSVEQLADRLSAMWTIQPRHGTDDPNGRRTVSAAAAQAAVTDAVTLVHWFSAGLITAAAVDA